MSANLTPKQARFVEEYLVNLNATQAAIRAGYSEKTARAQGHRLLTNVDIEEAIAAAKLDRSERVGVDQDRVVAELARIAFSDMRDFVTWGPGIVTLKAGEELSEDAAACVAEVSQTEHGVRFKLHSKLSALEALMRHLDASDTEARVRAIEKALGVV